VEASASYRVDLPRSEYRQSSPVIEPPAEAAEPDAPATQAHDITSISAAGEMFSEPAEVPPDATSHPAPMEVSEPASPIRHEGAVLSADALAPGFGVGGFAPRLRPARRRDSR